MTEAGSSAELAPWVQRMMLADQIFLTGTVLVLGEIRMRRHDLPTAYDERRLLRAATPRIAADYARQIADAYAAEPPYAAPDGVDEHWRIANMSREFAKRIDDAYLHGRD